MDLTEPGTVDYRVEILASRPLTVHFSLHNAAGQPLLVPRVLAPLGAFVCLEVRDAGGALVYESPTVKLHLKLHPDRPESYLSLEPAYTYGVMFTVDEVTLRPGPHELMISYCNTPYTGPISAPIGLLEFGATVPFVT